MNKRSLKFVNLILVFLLVSCSDNKYSKLDQDSTILAFGDSLTAGVGASQGQNYPAILAEMTNLNVINGGISGETTSQGLKRLPSLLDKYQPDLVILLEGGNDILRNHDRLKTKQNLSQMISLIKARQIDLLLIGVPEKKLFSNSAKIYDQLAEEFNLIYEDELLSDLLRSPQYKSDMIHLNAKGYRELAKGIKNILQKNVLID